MNTENGYSRSLFIFSLPLLVLYSLSLSLVNFLLWKSSIKPGKFLYIYTYINNFWKSCNPKLKQNWTKQTYKQNSVMFLTNSNRSFSKSTPGSIQSSSEDLTIRVEKGHHLFGLSLSHQQLYWLPNDRDHQMRWY